MPIPSANAADLVAGRAESDAQDFNDELITVDPYREAGENVAEVAAAEGMDRAAEDLLVGLRQLQGGDEIRWAVHRVGEMDETRNGFLIECATTNLTQTWLKDNFGGGTYRIRGHYPNGKYAAQRTIRVAGDAPRKVPVGGGSGNEGSSDFNLQSYLAQIDARDQRRRREEEERRRYEEDRDEKRRKERMDLLTALIPASVTALGAIFGGRQDNTAALITALKPPPPPDPLAMMLQLKALTANNDAGGVAKILPMLIEMAGQKASGGDTGWLDVVKELAKSAGPTIGGMIEMSVSQAKANAEAQRQLPPPAPLALAAPTGEAPGLIVLPEPRHRRDRGASEASPVGLVPPGVMRADGATAPTATAGGNDMSMMALLPHLPWLKEQLARFGKAAVAQRDPSLYAALFLEELPESIDVNVVGQLLSAPDWYAKLIQLEPRLNRDDLLPWFSHLRDGILRELRDDTPPSQPAGSAPVVPPAVSSTAVLPVLPVLPAQKEFTRPTQAPSLMGDD